MLVGYGRKPERFVNGTHHGGGIPGGCEGVIGELGKVSFEVWAHRSVYHLQRHRAAIRKAGSGF